MYMARTQLWLDHRIPGSVTGWAMLEPGVRVPPMRRSSNMIKLSLSFP
jgi:hypothetical protein